MTDYAELEDLFGNEVPGPGVVRTGQNHRKPKGPQTCFMFSEDEPRS